MPRHLLMAALCPVVISYDDDLHLLDNEVSLVRGGSYTYPEKVAYAPYLSLL